MPDRSGKLTQKVLSLLIALCLIATILPAVTAEGRETPFAAKLAAGTVFYADRDLKTETGTLAKDAVVLVTEEKGRADHISYKQENKKASAWVPKEAAAVLAATPTDLAPYLSDENLTITSPVILSEVEGSVDSSEDSEPSSVIPDESGDTPADVIPGDTPSVIPTGAEDIPTDVIPSEVEESLDSPSGSELEPEIQEPGDPSVIPDESGDTPTDVIPNDTSSVIPTGAEGGVEESLDPSSETDPAGQEPGEALTDEPGEGPTEDGDHTSVIPTGAEGEVDESVDPSSATPTDLAPEEEYLAHGGIGFDEEDWEKLYTQEQLEQGNETEENDQAVVTYIMKDGELTPSAYIPYFYYTETPINENVKTDIILPSARNQNPYGTCWAFSAVGGMEIDLIRDGHEDQTINLSEYFVAYFSAHNYDYPDIGMGGDSVSFEFTGTIGGKQGTYLDIGGNSTMAYRILAALIGVTAETDTENAYPKTDRSDQDKEPNSYTIAAQLTGAYLINPTERQAVKDMITAHGSIGASIFMAEGTGIIEYFTSGSISCGCMGYNGTYNAMYGNIKSTDHDILIVGWDDDFPASRFLSDSKLPAPAGNGAWLIRNSWGSNDWGMRGYFWVSYYDASINVRSMTAYDADVNRNAVTNDQGVQTDAGFQIDQYAYSYDKTPYSSYSVLVYDEEKADLVQTYKVRAFETITAVGVETGSDNLDLTVTVTAGDKSVSGSREALWGGFYRIPVSPISFTEDTIITVTVTYKPKVSGASFEIPYEHAGKETLGSVGERYIYNSVADGGGFTVNGDYFNGDPRIKIYTRDSGEGVKVSSISLDPTEINDVKKGDTRTLTATILPENATNKHIYWSSSNPSVASVESTGECTAKVTIKDSAGVAVITAETASSGKTDTCKVTVPVKEPDSIEFDGLNGATTYTINNDNAGSFWYGSQLKLTVKCNPFYATEKDIDQWTTSDPSVLRKVKEEGSNSYWFEAVGPGVTTITARHKNKDTGKYIYATIKIILAMERKVSSISLDRTSASITQDETLKLNATISPADAENKGVIWTSSNSDIASVDGAGYVYGQRWGTAVITVTTLDGNKTASCTVEVTPRDLVEAFVFRMYRVCLQRDPDEGGFRYWVDQLNSGKKTGAEAVFNFYDSKEMKNRNLPNDQYLTRLYEGIMGRGPDAGGYAYWMQIMETGMSRPYVISGFLTSKEFDNLCRKYGINKGSYSSSEPRDQNPGVTGFVSRLYTKLLGRSFDDNGLNYWCRIVLKEPTRATLLKVALDGFLHSKEFLNKHLGDTDYLMVLYRTFLDREAEPGGLNYWLGEMRSGMSRDKVAEGFANSQEFKNIMARYGFNK